MASLIWCGRLSSSYFIIFFPQYRHWRTSFGSPVFPSYTVCRHSKQWRPFEQRYFCASNAFMHQRAAAISETERSRCILLNSLRISLSSSSLSSLYAFLIFFISFSISSSLMTSFSLLISFIISYFIITTSINFSSSLSSSA